MLLLHSGNPLSFPCCGLLVCAITLCMCVYVCACVRARVCMCLLVYRFDCNRSHSFVAFVFFDGSFHTIHCFSVAGDCVGWRFRVFVYRVLDNRALFPPIAIYCVVFCPVLYFPVVCRRVALIVVPLSFRPCAFPRRPTRPSACLCSFLGSFLSLLLSSWFWFLRFVMNSWAGALANIGPKYH